MSVMQPGPGSILGHEDHKDWKSRVKRRSDCVIDNVEPTGKPTINLERSGWEIYEELQLDKTDTDSVNKW